MSNVNNVNRVLIGDGTNVSASTTHISGISKGDLFLVNESNQIVATNTAAGALAKFEKVYIAAGIGAGIAVLSSPIQGNTVSKFEGTTYAEASEQVTILGFDGTGTTNIPFAASTEYRLRILIKDSQRVQGQRSTIFDVNYTSSVTDTAGSVAKSVATLFAQKEMGENFIYDKVKLERISNGSYTALAANATVTNGSKTVTCTGHGLTTQVFVRIGGSVLGSAGTGTQSPVYGVKKIDNNTLELDLPYVGPTGTILAANIGKLSSVTQFGFKLTGIGQDSSIVRGGNEPLDEYEWINFDAVYSIADEKNVADRALTTNVSKVDPGQGYWKQVADREEKAKGYLGDTSKRRYYDKRINSVVDPTKGYNSIVITHSAIMTGEFQGQYSAPLLTEIYIPTGSAQATGSGNNFLHILNGFFGTKLGFPVIAF